MEDVFKTLGDAMRPEKGHAQGADTLLGQIVDEPPEHIMLDGDYETREIHVNGKFLSPVSSQKIINHSPDGFNWGYGGSGPAQLALAILLQFMPQEYARSAYQDFKFSYVAALPQDDFDVVLNLRAEIQKIIDRKSKI